MTDHTTRTLGSLISDPDEIIQRHANGIIKRLRTIEADATCSLCKLPVSAVVSDCPNGEHPDSISIPASPVTRP